VDLEVLMGKLRSGILGHLSGKVAGVVGTKWKDKSVLREYVVPGNPNTDPQKIQRANFGRAVAFAKLLVGQIFNVYVDKFQKSMSGFNYFISQNVALFTSPPTYASVKCAWGTLWGIAPTSAVYATGNVTISWDGSIVGNNGTDLDSVYAFVADSSTGMMYFAEAEVDRSDNTIVVPCKSGLTETNLKCYIFAAQYSSTSPTLLERVSNSAFKQATI
jgi:hypothetical protein